MASRHTTLSVAEKSYPTSEVSGSGLECQAAMAQERLRGGTLHPRSGVAAERCYPASEVSGDQEELPQVRGQGRQPRGVTLPPRSVVPGRKHPASEVRVGLEKPLVPETRGSDPKEPPQARGQGR